MVVIVMRAAVTVIKEARVVVVIVKIEVVVTTVLVTIKRGESRLRQRRRWRSS